MKNCQNCGQVNQDAQMQCGRCGAFLNAPQQPGFNQQNFNQPNSNQQNFNQQGFNQQSFNQPMPAAPAKKSSLGKILAIVGGSLAVLALLGGGLIFLLVTQTTQWKITGRWSIDSATANGVALPSAALQGTTVKFNWDQSYVTTLPNGTTEGGAYKVVNEQTISMTDRKGQPMTFSISFDRNKMTLNTTKDKVTVLMNYSKLSN